MKRKTVKKMLSLMTGAFLLFGSLSGHVNAQEAAAEIAAEEAVSETETEDVFAGTATDGQIVDAEEEALSETESETVLEEAGAADNPEAEPGTDDAQTQSGTDSSPQSGAEGPAENNAEDLAQSDAEDSAETAAEDSAEDVSEDSSQSDTDDPKEDAGGVTEEIFTASESAQADLLDASTDSIEMEGKPVVSSGSVYQIVTSGSEVYKGNYNLLGDKNNKAQFVFTPFNNAGDDVVYLEAGGAKYFVPKSTSAAGKYGFLVENVGFNSEENCKLDMRFTVDAFHDYVYDMGKNKISDMYPAFGFFEDEGLYFAFAGPDQNIRIEILKHGTNTQVKGNYSFRWLDIDNGQRFGISLANGTLSGRYALDSCSTYYQDGYSSFGRSYHMVNAPQDSAYSLYQGDWLDGTVYWELENCSELNLLIATPGNSTQGRHWKTWLVNRYEQYSTGIFTSDAYTVLSALGWDGESYGPRENPTQLCKYVSNQDEEIENLNGKTANTLETDGQTYYYFLENYVPVEPEDYYYNLYTVTDTLPSGADYNGSAQVVKGETGEDVTGWFDISAKDDKITFSANHMDESEFYGSTYIFKFQAKMDSSEITPVNEGNQNIYTLKNTGTVTSRHKTDSSSKSGVSSEVTTTLRELGTGNLRVTKTDTAGKPLAGAVYEVTAKGDILSPAGAVLVKAGTIAATLTTGEDGTALAQGLYAGTYVIAEIKPPKGFSLNTAQQQAEVPGTGTGCAEVKFQNEKTRVYLKKVSELTEGETERQPIPGVSFLVWKKESGEAQGTFYTTDKNGQICLEGYEPGEYCYREETTPEGYVPDSTVREFTIDENGRVSNEANHVILVENACICAQFAKTDRVTGQLVAGAELSLTDALGQEVETWVSGSTPHRISRIPAGTYTLTELSAPEGYQKGEPVTCVIGAQTGIQSFELSDLKYVGISITKTIHADEVVWAHGNPVFTFVISGTDLDGNAWERTAVLEFTQENTGNAAQGDYSLSTQVSVPAGTYTVRELSTARYRLESLTVSENGTVQGEEALLDLTGNKDADVCFTNTKVTDQYLTETAFVRNQIIK